MLIFFNIIFSIIILTSCGGYNLQKRDNPFDRYDIKSVRIPVFFNDSTLMTASGPFTQEFRKLFFDFPGLKLTNSSHEPVDAVLLGIITSAEKRKETVRSASLRVADPADLKEGKTARRRFYIPAANIVQFKLRLVLMKNPSQDELQLLGSDLLKGIKWNERIIFDEEIVLSRSFNREFYQNEASNVLYTQNESALNDTIKQMATQAVNRFKNTILYAF